MVSADSTIKMYRGKKAATYDVIRVRQRKWHREAAEFERMLRDLRADGARSVLDVPCGTGRFFTLYRAMKFAPAVGVDASEVMLGLAKTHARRDVELRLGDARRLDFADKNFDVVLCSRLLNLIDDEAMRQVVREICRVARRAVLLNVRIGARYLPKGTTATHAAVPFAAHVGRQGWQIAERVLCSRDEYYVMMLTRRKT